MRLIDSDKLCEDLLDRWNTADARKEELVRQVMADIVTPIIACQPTIEQQKKTGRWLMSDDFYETAVCSHCGFDTADAYTFITSN